MRSLTLFILLITSLYASVVYAGGVGLGVTRMVYSGVVSQSLLDVRNTDTESSFLIQSWVENSQGQRSSDFVITPPLFVLKPEMENAVKVMFNGKQLPQDRETLYWITVKAIPQSVKQSSTNTLQFASASRIKLFYRPVELTKKTNNEEWKSLNGEFHDGKVKLINPTPFYITTINMKVDGKAVKPIMIPPKDAVILEESFSHARQLSYQTINDYGAWTSEVSLPLTKR
ncbi:fimbria/pilus periplasmic chaperone [Yersinia mollaretii]|uniref:P pilus assembly protein, chaperone PapD n=1 Tax=Yersinia mollaretii (strain ATCC 43969 / DSM 18520 / CIP 103324 / CNY 7263 / WAIP 204) TaxID=349967 RepID=A0ABP2EIK0_YERMW|nr:fimbria/pilus periplasmic chaperone [Yersinia mollaretii]EEQ10900.1 P pilus assembly protein, chaperone PapD [Yersinia mollaretii ATCC 43969]PJE87901.1 pilus assembly protein PapD [Yersinia mollaretii]QKJ02636.1 fimbria/pilus periplasmic chaperone [Yersinia mollaretii ATCC 43969]CQD41072.1 putative fimbrial chaperone protein [Yersinia mollaretii]CQH22040.1 putative fimbrial chaperone protein [Yersinia mollaretii]